MKNSEEKLPKTTMSACEFLEKLIQKPNPESPGLFSTFFSPRGSDYDRGKMLENMHLMQKAQAACFLGMNASIPEGASLNQVEFTENKTSFNYKK